MTTKDVKFLIKTHKNIIYRLEKMLEKQPKQINEVRFPSDTIVNEVNKMFQCDVREITRKKRVVYARHAAVYLLKTHTNLTWVDMAKYVGNTHHTSCIHSFRAAQDILETDSEYLETINKIKLKLTDLKN